MIRQTVRKDRLMPTFARGRAEQFRGTPPKYTLLNLGCRWNSDDIVDAPDRCEVSLWWKRTGREAAPSDVTITRARKFKPAPGAACTWTFGDQNGQGAPDPAGLLTVPGLKLTATPTRLVMKRR